MSHSYDVLVVGAGIAGSEAALGCASKGLNTLLVTTLLDSSYNLFSDTTYLKPLHGTWMSSAVSQQVNAWELHRAAKYALEHTPNLHCLQSSVSGLIVQDKSVIGVKTWEGISRYSDKVVLCVGSFLNARLTLGVLIEQAGRLSEMAYDDLYLDLCSRGFRFETLTLQASDVQPGYEVSCKVFAGEFDPKTFRSHRLNHLYAAGLCAFGKMSYEEAAKQGILLADELAK